MNIFYQKEKRWQRAAQFGP